MSAPGQTRNLAARAGRWSAQHRKAAIWGWLASMIVLFALGSGAGTKTIESAQDGVGESGRGSATLQRAFPKHVTEEVLIQNRAVAATDPAFRAVVADVQRRLAAAPFTQNFQSPMRPAVRAGSHPTGTRRCCSSSFGARKNRRENAWMRRWLQPPRLGDWNWYLPGWLQWLPHVAGRRAGAAARHDRGRDAARSGLRAT